MELEEGKGDEQVLGKIYCPQEGQKQKETELNCEVL